ncbi:hypothetical protein [Paenisporosarcina indica]|uniref:hypothetical protein n=1 Tax=Paenisporosarcina indica TaxID=650093 RepID=UPI00094FE9C4|nr:hypothetical protein [Paenisporosarcina indica]
MKHLIMFVVIFFILLVAGCNGSPGEDTPGYLTKEQVLKENPEADYFELNNKDYVRGNGWIEEVELTKEEIIGEIEVGMASDLPLGTNIVAPKERRDILIVEHNGIEIRYLLQLGE